MKQDFELQVLFVKELLRFLSWPLYLMLKGMQCLGKLRVCYCQQPMSYSAGDIYPLPGWMSTSACCQGQLLPEDLSTDHLEFCLICHSLTGDTGGDRSVLRPGERPRQIPLLLCPGCSLSPTGRAALPWHQPSRYTSLERRTVITPYLSLAGPE